MSIAAAIVGVLFGAFHGAGAWPLLRAPVAPRGSGQPGAVPLWGRVAWVGLAALTVIASATLALIESLLVVAVLAVGALGICAFAVANGYWMKGRPTVSHHLVRAVGAIVVVGLALLSR